MDWDRWLAADMPSMEAAASLTFNTYSSRFRPRSTTSGSRLDGATWSTAIWKKVR